MRAIVGVRWAHYTIGFESLMFKLYCDVKGYPSIGDGLLCPRELAVTIPFTHDVDASPATPEEIGAAWDLVYAARATGPEGGEHFESLTTISATLDGINLVSARKLREFELELRQEYPGWDSFGADVQLAILSKAWACGGYFPPKWPRYSAAVNAGQWGAAADQAKPSPAEMARQNPSFHKRIACEIRHLRAAMTATDPETFAVWPTSDELAADVASWA